MAEWLSVVIALLAVLALLPFVWRRSSVPAPWALPLVGDTLALIKSPAKYFVRRHLQLGPVYRVNLVGVPNLHIICDPDAARSLLKASPEEVTFFAPGASFAKLFPNNKYLNVNDHHRHWRKAMHGSLAQQGVAAMLPALDSVIKQQIKQWAQKGEFELANASKALALALGVGVISGIPLDASNTDEAVELCWTYNAGLFDPFGLDVPGTALHAALKAREKLKNMLWASFADSANDITAKYQQRDQDQTADEGVEAADASPAAAAAGEPMTMLEAQLCGAAPYYKVDAALAVERALGNVIAAAETSRHMFFSTICCVALSPRVRAKLIDEQRQFLASHGEDLSLRTLNAMTYLDATVKEIMRLLPSSNGSFRQLVTPLKVGGHTLPTGTPCMISTHILHALDPAALKGGPLSVNANGLPPHLDYETGFDVAFQPERWLQDDTKPRSYATFGLGTHLCLGLHVAYAEAKLLLVNLLRSCSFELCDKAILTKVTAMFPGPAPVPGTDRVRITLSPLTAH